MAKRNRKGVTIVVDEGFFNTFESERKKQQKISGVLNLTQRNFTEMLAIGKFKFSIPTQKTQLLLRPKRKIVRRRRTR